MKKINEDHKEIQSGKVKDEEGYMAKVEMDKIMQSLQKLKKTIKSSDQQLPSWIQNKIIKASDYLDIAADYLSSDVEMDENISFEISPKHKEIKSREQQTEKIKGLTKSPNPNEAEVARKKLSARGPQLPPVKEQTSLVDKILSEMMGDKPGCDTKKPKNLDDIAKKHKVSTDTLKKELKKGIKVEMEHTTDRGEAEIIALHHLDELPDYYTRLLKMEKEADVMNEDLRDWLKSGVGGGGWDRYNTKGERVGKCGDAKEGDPYAACLSKEKADKLGKKGISNFVNRKRAAQSKSGYDEKGEGPKGRKPVFVKTKVDEEIEFLEEENTPTNPELWSRAKALAKEKFDVYPSAYANLWASKWYKKKGGSWKKKSINEEKKNNTCCVPVEEQVTRLPMQNGQLLRVLINWRGRHISSQIFFPSLRNPTKNEISYEINKVYPEARVISFVPCEMDSSQPLIQIQNNKSKNYLLNNNTIGEETLNKPMRTPGERKKFKVYVRDPKTGNVVTVRFGDPNLEIKRDDPERRKNFRARHRCDDAKDKTTPRYWSCRQWRAGEKVED